jgi:hypothetical protein
MNQVVIVWEAVAGISLPYLPIKDANFWFIDVCDQAPLRLSRMQNTKSLTLY